MAQTHLHRATGADVARTFVDFARAARRVVVVVALVGACSGEAGSPSDQPDLVSTPPSATAAEIAPAPTPPQPTAATPTAVPRVPGPVVPRVAPLQPPAYASRIVVSDLGIDLPVISGDLQPPPSYPLCDVAAYVTRFSQPYEQGVTYISAHAQGGMFAPLLEASTIEDGQGLIGMRVDLYTNDARRFTYVIDRVVRHAVDYAVVNTVSLEERTLILQTSEGPYGTAEKLQVLATFGEEAPVAADEATPEARPRDCRPPELGGPSATP